MLKKACLLLPALLFAVGANLRPCWEYSGEPALSCGLRTARLAERAAQAAAEELCPGPAALPAPERRLRLQFGRPGQDARPLSDALLRRVEGVEVRDEVCVDGERLGFVADGDALREALAVYIGNTLPTWAQGGLLSRELTVRSLYTRAGPLTAQGDMLLLVTGMAPVLYYDGTGYTARA